MNTGRFEYIGGTHDTDDERAGAREPRDIRLRGPRPRLADIFPARAPEDDPDDKAQEPALRAPEPLALLATEPGPQGDWRWPLYGLALYFGSGLAFMVVSAAIGS